MRTLRKIFTVTLIATLWLAAISFPGAANNLPNEESLTVYCDTDPPKTSGSGCNFNKDKSCSINLIKGGGEDAKAVRWKFKLDNLSQDPIVLEQTVEQTCTPVKVIIEPGENKLNYICNPGISHFDLYIAQKSALQMKNMTCSEKPES